MSHMCFLSSNLHIYIQDEKQGGKSWKTRKGSMIGEKTRGFKEVGENSTTKQYDGDILDTKGYGKNGELR